MEWIDVKDKLPKYGVWVIVYDYASDTVGEDLLDPDLVWVEHLQVGYWMPMPERPWWIEPKIEKENS